MGVQGNGHAEVSCLSCLAAVLLAGLLGCGGHGLRVAPGHDSDVVGPVSDAMAADVSNGPVDSGGLGSTTDTVTSSLEAGVAGQKDASADTSTSTKIEAGLPDAGVVDLAAAPDRRVDAGADTTTRADAAIDAGPPEAGVVDAGVPDAPVDAPQVPDATRSPDAGPSLDACVPLACSNRMTCVSDYCGTIGDGCGGTLHCPTTCPNALWSCVDGVCKSGLETHCVPLSCIAYAGNDYCGDIYDGCGGTVHCGACARAGWICQNGLCIGPPSVCTPTTCDAPNGESYCGTICNVCGGSLDCGTTCPKSGWVCDNGLCKGIPPTCTLLTCNPAGGQYCGAIGDGCGGTLDCGRECSDGSTCGERVPGVCGSSSDLPAPPLPAPPPSSAVPISCSSPPAAPCPPPPPPP